MINIHEIEYWVLTLDIKGDRMKRFKQTCERNSIFASPFIGFQGKKFQLNSPHYSHINYGMVGNFISHIMLLRQQQVKPGWTLIMEDDILLAENFTEKLKGALSSMPTDRDIYFIGWIPYIYDENTYPYKEQPIEGHDKWLDVVHFHGNFGYLVKNSNIEHILNTLPEMYQNVDWTILDLQKSGKLKCAFYNEPIADTFRRGIINHDYHFESLVPLPGKH